MAKTKSRSRAAIEDPMIPLIRIASRQLDDAKHGGRLGWLLSFVREEPAEWLPGDVEAHGYRLLALIYPLPPNMLRLGVNDIPPVTPESVEEIHSELRRFFGELVTRPAGQSIKIPTDELKEVLVRASAPGEKPAIFGVSRGGPRRTLVFQAVKALVLGAGDRLLACPKCGRPFLGLRKRRFCEQRCLQAWHDAKRPKKGGGR